MKSVGEQLPIEQARVRELIKQYRDPILGSSGEFAARMMEISLQNADHAIISGDIAEMIRAYEDLKGYN